MAAISMKTKISSRSKEVVPENTAVNPKDVPCPTCNAPIGGQCFTTDRVITYVEWFHIGRVDDAINAVSRTSGADNTNSGEQPRNEPTGKEEWPKEEDEEPTGEKQY